MRDIFLYVSKLFLLTTMLFGQESDFRGVISLVPRGAEYPDSPQVVLGYLYVNIYSACLSFGHPHGRAGFLFVIPFQTLSLWLPFTHTQPTHPDRRRLFSLEATRAMDCIQVHAFEIINHRSNCPYRSPVSIYINWSMTVPHHQYT